MKKKASKRLRLSTETLLHLDLAQVTGGLTSFWSCPEPPVTKAFSGCEYCVPHTILPSDPDIC